MKTAVIYARYSSDRQTEQSIEGQLHVCEDFAKRNDILILDTYIDRAISGTHDMRENFQKMLKDSDNKAWDYVLVYKLDRFSRNKYEMAIHRKHLKDNGIKILSAVENIPETPEGTLLESLLEGMNQYYSEELSQKTKRGMNETRLKGNFIGGNVNYGYERDGAKLKVNPDEAEIVVRMFTDYVNGKKVSQIARELNEQGLRNKGNMFLSTSIHNILRQEKYTGIYRVNGQVYDKIYPPILDKDIYELARQKIEKNKHGCRKANHVVFLLKNKVFCGYCGKRLYALSAKSNNGQPLRYYKCYDPTHKTKECPSKIIRKDFLEEIVNKAILKVFATPNNISMFSDKVFDMHKKRVTADNTLNLLNQDLASTIKSISNIMNAIEKGIFTETTKARLEELEKEKRELEKKITIAKSQEKAMLTKEEIANYFKYSLKQSTENMINLLVKQVIVYNDKIEIAFNYTKYKSVEGEETCVKIFSKTFTKIKNLRGKKQQKQDIKYDIYVKI